MIDREAKVTIEREDAPFDLLRSTPCLVVVTHQHPKILRTWDTSFFKQKPLVVA